MVFGLVPPCPYTANKKRKTEKKWTLFYNRLFYKALQNNSLFLFRKLILSSIFGCCYQSDARNIKRENRQRQIGKKQSTFACSKLTIETLEQGEKYVQS